MRYLSRPYEIYALSKQAIATKALFVSILSSDHKLSHSLLLS